MRPMSVGKKKQSGNAKMVSRFHPKVVDNEHLVHIHLRTEEEVLPPLMKYSYGEKYTKSLNCDIEYTGEI